ncbi:MAG TPA: M28 family peptidase [Nitrospira sp.]|nr:M28 family peptidase [Nitrospira sp.]
MQTRRTTLLRHLHSLVGERHPQSAPQALNEAAEYLAARFAEYGWTPTRHAFPALGKSYVNIVAIKHPAGRAGRQRQAPLLVGAHYDTAIGSPGADDNASALAVLLEAADRLRHTVLTRPVWLAAFSLEEHGLLGSRAFISSLKHRGQPLEGAIVLECVGYASQEAGSQRTPPGISIPVPSVGNFLGVVGNEASRHLVAAVERSARRVAPGTPTVALTVPAKGEMLPDVRRSDHAAFWDEGYPALMLTDTANFRNPHYHQPSDTLDTLDLDFLAGVSDIVVASLKDLAGGDLG